MDHKKINKEQSPQFEKLYSLEKMKVWLNLFFLSLSVELNSTFRQMSLVSDDTRNYLEQLINIREVEKLSKKGPDVSVENWRQIFLDVDKFCRYWFNIRVPSVYVHLTWGNLLTQSVGQH